MEGAGDALVNKTDSASMERRFCSTETRVADELSVGSAA